MDCKTKDGLLIFLLVFCGILLAIVLVGLFLFIRKKVKTSHQVVWPLLRK